MLSANDLTPKETLFIATECHLASLQDNDGDTPLHISIVRHDTQKSLELIRLFQISRKSIDILNRLMQTPLHLAVITSQCEVVDGLLNCAANPNVLDRFGCNVAHIAAKYNSLSCLQSVFKYSKFPVDIEKINLEGVTALHVAVQNNSINVLKQLLQHGANIDVKDNKSGRSALIYAIESDNVIIVELLLEQGASVCEQTYSGDTALHIASGRAVQSIIRLLLRKGADATNRNLPNEDLHFFSPDSQLQTLQMIQAGMTNGEKHNAQLMRSMSCPTTPSEPKCMSHKSIMGKHQLENENQDESEISIKRNRLEVLKKEMNSQILGSSGSTISTNKTDIIEDSTTDKRCIFPCIKPFGFSSYSSVLPPPPPILSSGRAAYLPPQFYKEELFRKCIQDRNVMKTSVSPFLIIPKQEKDVSPTITEAPIPSPTSICDENKIENCQIDVRGQIIPKQEGKTSPALTKPTLPIMAQYRRQAERSMSLPGSPNPSDEALFQVAREGLAVAAMPSLSTSNSLDFITQANTVPSKIRPARQAEIKSKTNELQKLALQGLAVAAMKEMKHEIVEKSRGTEYNEIYRRPLEHFISKDGRKSSTSFGIPSQLQGTARQSPIEPSLLLLAQASVVQPGVAQAISVFNGNVGETVADDASSKREDHQISDETKQSLREAILEKKKSMEPKVPVSYTTVQTASNQTHISVEIVRPNIPTTLETNVKTENTEDVTVSLQQNESLKSASSETSATDDSLQNIRQRLVQLNYEIQHLLSPSSDRPNPADTQQRMSTYSAEYARLCQKAKELSKNTMVSAEPAEKSAAYSPQKPVNPLYPVASIRPVHQTVFPHSPQLVLHPQLMSPQLPMPLHYPYMVPNYSVMPGKHYPSPMYYLDYRRPVPTMPTTHLWQNPVTSVPQKSAVVATVKVLNTHAKKTFNPGQPSSETDDAKLIKPVHQVPNLPQESYALPQSSQTVSMTSAHTTTTSILHKKPMAAVIAIPKLEVGEDQPLNLSKKEEQPLNLQTSGWNSRITHTLSTPSSVESASSKMQTYYK
ncbi:uncharacterized protein LOC778910 isoform X1 [Ciona intestinalis]